MAEAQETSQGMRAVDPGGPLQGTGESFIPAPQRRGFGRVRTELPPGIRRTADATLGRAGEGQAREPPRGAGPRGIAGDREIRGGSRSTLPPGFNRFMKEKKSAKTVSMNFGMFAELPEPASFHAWLKKQNMLGQQEQEKQVEWVDRNIFSKKFLVNMKHEQGAEWLSQEFGEGRDWLDPDTGTTHRIIATWEGQSWKQLIIRGIDPHTAETTVKQVFSQYGEQRQLQFLEMDGIRYNQASLQVKVKEDAELPVFIFAQGGKGVVERWEVDYRGKPRTVCYRCFQEGHIKQRCNSRPVSWKQLSVPGGRPGSYAQVAKRQLTQEELEGYGLEEGRQRDEEEAARLRQQEEQDLEEQGSGEAVAGRLHQPQQAAQKEAPVVEKELEAAQVTEDQEAEEEGKELEAPQVVKDKETEVVGKKLEATEVVKDQEAKHQKPEENHKKTERTKEEKEIRKQKLHHLLEEVLRVQNKAKELDLQEDIKDITKLASSSKVDLKTLERELRKLEKKISGKKERNSRKRPPGSSPLTSQPVTSKARDRSGSKEVRSQ